MKRSVGAIALLISLLGCSREDDPGAPREVTFYEDVAPIVYENCVGCHRPDSVAPFSLIEYESARLRAAAMAVHTRDRHMPPMPVDNSGACNTYENARWLTDSEIETIAAWAEQGAPAGNPDRAPPVPEAPAGLGSPDLTLDPGFEYSPNDSLPDDYHCFVIPAPAAETTYVTAYEVVPGDPRVVHHVIVYQPNDQAAVLAAHALDDAEAGEGYTCFGGSGVASDPLALWAPGAGVVELPAGTGVQLHAGRDLVMQVHYNLAAGSYPDRSVVNLRVDDTARAAAYIAIADTEMQLAPGRSYVETQASFALDPTQPFTVHGALPHMHTLGRTLEVDVREFGLDECLVLVDRWNFHWQNAWWYDEPKRFGGASSATIRCGYDTSSRTEVVRWGEGTMDEMCVSYFYVTGG